MNRFSAFLGVAASAIAVAVAAPAAVAQPAPPPVEAYAALPAVDFLSISPNGQNLAFVGRAPNGARRMGVRTVAGEVLGVVELGDQKVRSISWADDDHVLVTTSDYVDLEVMGDDREVFAAQSYNVRTREFVTLLNRTNRSLNTQSIHRDQATGNFYFIVGAPFQQLVNGRMQTFVRSLTNDYEVGVFAVDLDTGRGTLMPDFGGVVDASGRTVARSGWDRDSGRWWLSTRAPGASDFTEAWSGTGYRIDTPSLLGYGRTRDTVLIDVPEAEGNVLYEVPLAGGRAVRLNLGLEGDPSPIYHPRDDRLLGFQVATGTGTEYVFLDENLGGIWAGLEAGFPDRHVTLASTTPDFSRLIIQTDGQHDAGSYFLVDTQAGTAVPAGSRYPDVPANTIGEQRFVTYTAADGTEIPAYLTLPPGREARSLPLIVLPHGGPQARDYPGFDYWAQLLASRGYAVLQPQFRGSEGFGRAHIEAGYGQWGRSMQTDLSDGVRWLAGQGTIDPARVCIMGWSYGGYAAMAGVTLDPDVYRCAVAGAGVSDLPRMLAWERDQTGGRDTTVMRYWRRFMGAERINDNSIAEVSPARLVDRVHAPVLLIHGRDDSVVPFEQSTIFRDAMQRSGREVELVELTGEDHWLSREQGRIAVFRAAVDFLQRHNPPN